MFCIENSPPIRQTSKASATMNTNGKHFKNYKQGSSLFAQIFMISE